MAKLKAKLLKGGRLKIFGLEELIDSRIAALKKSFGVSKPVAKATEYVRPAVKPNPVAKKSVAKPKKAAKVVKTAKAPSKDAFASVMSNLAKHPGKNALIRAGSQPDQLLRSLIPLYLAQGSGVDVTSGVITNFWKKHGVKFAAPNAAKALRQHVGYARQTKAGREITPNGVKYVEAAVQKKAA